jgi:crotonobetainyl-CoA:carnitine CoA-transferase CaiB-like acyl-CoA transferase
VTSPLDGWRVVEVSDRIAGSYCGKLFVDAGAEVVKVEPAAGDPLRRFTACDADTTSDAPLFAYLAAGKRSIVASAGGPRFLDVCAEADVVLVTGTPVSAGRLGVDVAAIRSANPAAAVVTISDFGWSGPWAERPATEFTLQAWCGASGFRGIPERPPVSVGGAVGEYLGGVFAAVAAVAVARSGAGAHADVSLLECMTLGMQGFEWLHVALMDLPGLARSIEVPSIEPARDGWVGMSMVTGQQWLDFAAMVEMPPLIDVADFRFQMGRWPRRQEVYDLIHPWFAERTVDEIVRLAELYRIPMAPIGDGASIPEMNHFVERGVFVRNPAGFRQPRPPWRMSAAEPAPLRPAPRLGQHTNGAVWTGDRTAGRSAGDGERSGLPLAGLRIVDFTAFWAGPSSTVVLAALGADVVKVESIQRPDGMRAAGGLRPGAERWWEYSWLFHGVNVDKRSITLDLSRPAAIDLAKRLIAGADAVVENFSPRVMEQFGLGYNELRAIDQRVVLVRMPAFGLDGPWRDRVGFAPTMEQLAGMAGLTGYPDGAPMAPRGVCDPLAGVHAAFALLAALEHRDRTGEGQLVELPMVEVALNATAQLVVEHDVFGVVLQRDGNRGPMAAPQNIYACAGEERWLALAVATDEQWQALVNMLGGPEWARDERLATHAGRRAAHDRLDVELSAWFAQRKLDQIVEDLSSAGIPAAPVVSPPAVVDNPQMRARHVFQPLDHPCTGVNDYAAMPFSPLAGSPAWCRTPPPTLGQHNDEVLGGLGLSPEELAELRAAKIIGDRPVGL